MVDHIYSNIDSFVNDLIENGLKAQNAGYLLEAITQYQKVLEIAPGRFDLLLNIGAALHDLGMLEEALSVYDNALLIRNDWGEILTNRGNTLLALNRFQEALDSYMSSFSIIPEHIDVLVTAGTALEYLGRYDEALQCYEKAILSKPDKAEAHWNRALWLLRMGRYTEGWDEFEWRWDKKGYTTASRIWAVPLWDGRRLNGETVLVHAEQAFGDVIQFVRFIPLIAEKGATIAIECHKSLVPLIKSVKGVTAVFETGTALTSHEFHIPLLSIPKILGTTLDTVPASIPYLFPDISKCKLWQSRLSEFSEFKIGLVWAGRNSPDPNRSCGFASYLPLFNMAEIRFFSLQIGEGSKEPKSFSENISLVDFTKYILNFADTAALINALDLIITIDTSVAHLAGALGKETCLLVPVNPDWRWMLNRSDSAWYPTLRIFRQKIIKEWSDVIEEVKRYLTVKLSKLS